jgi:ABC-type lipoprotein export system ATPase subunit
MMDVSALVELQDVTKRYEPAGSATGPEVLKGVNLRLKPGESLAVVGPSGSGKSTLLNIIGALDRATSGTVLVGGRDLSYLTDSELAGIRNKWIGFVFQLHHLLPQLTVLENVLAPTLAGDGATDEAVARARKLLERVGLGERTSHRPGQLSGGERQRAAIVRALINQPRLVLADEPTGQLDRAAARGLAALLAELNREQDVTLIVVTHSLDLARGMGRVMELRDGKLLPPGEAA